MLGFGVVDESGCSGRQSFVQLRPEKFVLTSVVVEHVAKEAEVAVDGSGSFPRADWNTGNGRCRQPELAQQRGVDDDHVSDVDEGTVRPAECGKVLLGPVLLVSGVFTNFWVHAPIVALRYGADHPSFVGTLRREVSSRGCVGHDERVTTVRGRMLADRLEGAIGSCGDIEAVARTVCAAMAEEVPFTFGCLATTDPASGLITWAYKTHPLDIGDEDFAAAEYGDTDINQFADIARRSEPVGVLSIDTAGRPDRSRRFREFLAPRFGFSDELRVVFRAQGLTWGVLALYRGDGADPFTTEQARTLASVHQHVADAIRRALFATALTSAALANGPAVIIVDGDDRVRDMTSTARERIDDVGGWENSSLPTSVLAVVAAARTTPDLATTRVLARSAEWLTLRATTLEGATAPREVVVTIDTAQRADISRLALTARGLTAREQDVAGLVLQGASTGAIAAALHLSPHTVQDHLKAIFAKLGVNSRREMIAQLLLL